MANRKSEEAQWFVLTVQLDPEVADEAEEYLREALEVEPVQWILPEAGQAWLEVYFPVEMEALLAAELVRHRFTVQAVRVHCCADRDWRIFWHHHFHTLPLGRRLVIVPSWEADEPSAAEPGRMRILINPGLSFGTGNHFTTRFCLENLEALSDQGVRGALLDMGTGSGILAIAGVKLGFDPVTGVDHEESVLDQAMANAALNGVEDRIAFIPHDVRSAWKGPFCEVVCANLFGLLLIESAALLRATASKYLVLTGIRDVETDAVAETYIALGCSEVVRDGDGEWSGLVFRVDKQANA